MRLAARTTENRKRTLFPSDEAAEPTRPRQTMNPPGKPSSPASVSASVSASGSRDGREESASVPMHLRSFGSQAVVPCPEGRQGVAQRVSGGLRSPIEIQPQRGDRPPPPDERHHSLAFSRIQGPRTQGGQAAKPRSRQGIRLRRQTHLTAIFRVFASANELCTRALSSEPQDCRSGALTRRMHCGP